MIQIGECSSAPSGLPATPGARLRLHLVPARGRAPFSWPRGWRPFPLDCRRRPAAVKATPPGRRSAGLDRRRRGCGAARREQRGRAAREIRGVSCPGSKFDRLPRPPGNGPVLTSWESLASGISSSVGCHSGRCPPQRRMYRVLSAGRGGERSSAPRRRLPGTSGQCTILQLTLARP